MAKKSKAVSKNALTVEFIPVAVLHADDKNVREHSERNLDAIKASLAKFGQQKPIVIDEQNVVIAGNGTLVAAKSLGWNEIAVVRSSLSQTEATAFAIADNRTSELASWNLDGLDLALRDLSSVGVDLIDIGFSSGDISDLLGKDHWQEANVEKTDSVYAEKVVVVITDMAVRAPLRSLIAQLIEQNGWQGGATIV